jgi:hypothetical protein
MIMSISILSELLVLLMRRVNKKKRMNERLFAFLLKNLALRERRNQIIKNQRLISSEKLEQKLDYI